MAHQHTATIRLLKTNDKTQLQSVKKNIRVYNMSNIVQLRSLQQVSQCASSNSRRRMDLIIQLDTGCQTQPSKVKLTRGATTSSELGVQFLRLGYYYPSTETIRQVYPVWCSRSHNHTLFIKKLRKKLWVRPNLAGSDPPPDPQWLSL